MNLVKFTLGDWSDDGHCQSASFGAVLSDGKTVQDVREAHFRAPEVLGFEIGDICAEHEEFTIRKDIADKIKDAGVSLPDDDSPSSEGVFVLWLALLNHIDPSLDLVRNTYIAGENVEFYGYDDQNRHLRVPGYGCHDLTW